jgi:hypothetical protein
MEKPAKQTIPREDNAGGNNNNNFGEKNSIEY